jgi:hypothetical protein
MKRVKSLFVCAGMLLAYGATASSAELVVTTGKTQSKAGTAALLSFDLASNGNVAGFEFKIDMPETLDKKGIVLSNCVSDLPKNFVAQCGLMDTGDVLVFVFSPDSVLPAGVHSVGTVSFAGLPESPRIYDLNVADRAGKSLDSKLTVSE